MAEQPDIDPHTNDQGDSAADEPILPRTQRGEDSSADDALSVDTVVVEERGRWAVGIVVVFADGIVRKRIDSHPTKARAELSARMIKRAAERDIRGPLNG
ncbi:hypothetical protein [Mycobacterium hubeiense]|uniref:hypothetical protein n=1 Tax=Mycobacterium hubeiense TaxID=1867256 RepID=UPI001E51A977|nr:hypothetical protein [Mycobacterium sp. QGD 101]